VKEGVLLHAVLGRVFKLAGVVELFLYGAVICHAKMGEARGPD